MPPRSVEASRVTRQNFRTGNRKLRGLSVLCQLSGRGMIARLESRASNPIVSCMTLADRPSSSIINNPSIVSIVGFLYRYPESEGGEHAGENDRLSISKSPVDWLLSRVTRCVHPFHSVSSQQILLLSRSPTFPRCASLLVKRETEER